MIDCHCHLEQKDYDKDREEVIERCKKELKAVVSCCAHPRDIEKALAIEKKYKGFVFLSIGLHPEFIKEIDKKDVKKVTQAIKENKDIVAIGEVGLDYYWVKEKNWQEKQKELFLEFIKLTKELSLPLVVHSRNASLEVIKILEQQNMKKKKVLLHLFQDKNLLSRVINNKWFISIGPGILKSKTTKKIARDTPLQNLLLETDSPWFGFGKRNEPISVRIACKKISEIKKMDEKEVERETDLNAINFFNLNKKLK